MAIASRIKKKEARIRIGPISHAVLGTVLATGAVSALAIIPGVTVVIAPFLKKKKYQPKQAIQKSVNTLVTQGLLKKEVDDSGVLQLRLTRKGKWFAMIRGCRGEQDVETKKWDGLWRVVIFDVPNSKNSSRRQLRRAMQMYGFVQLQKSVWVYPFPCEEFVNLIKENIGVSQNVSYMIVQRLENDSQLKKNFGI